MSGFREAAEVLAREIEDPRVQRPGMQRRRRWADRVRRLRGLMANGLWLVEIHEDDWDYDRFEKAVVLATSPEEAELIVRTAHRYTPEQLATMHQSNADELWIENPAWRLTVTPAPDDRIVLVHWHAG